VKISEIVHRNRAFNKRIIISFIIFFYNLGIRFRYQFLTYIVQLSKAQLCINQINFHESPDL